ncbi:hypothetical protein JCM10599A_58530 [Paraburkholderia kururiensis]
MTMTRSARESIGMLRVGEKGGKLAAGRQTSDASAESITRTHARPGGISPSPPAAATPGAALHVLYKHTVEFNTYAADGVPGLTHGAPQRICPGRRPGPTF